MWHVMGRIAILYRTNTKAHIWTGLWNLVVTGCQLWSLWCQLEGSPACSGGFALEQYHSASK